MRRAGFQLDRPLSLCYPHYDSVACARAATESQVIRNQRLWFALAILVILIAGAGLLIRSGGLRTRHMAGQLASARSTTPLILHTRAATEPSIVDGSPFYLIHDWRLGSHDASDWRQSYPGWQMTGGWIEATWEEVNPAPGIYDFSRLIRYVESSVTPANTRLTAISILLHGRDEGSAKRLADWTPAWVYESMPDRPVVEGRPVGYLLQPQGCDCPAALPLYDNETWQRHVDELLDALAQEFDHPDRYPNLRALSIGWGFEGLDLPTHDVVCEYSAQLSAELEAAYETWTEHLIARLAARFEHRLIWLMTTPAHAAPRAEQIMQHRRGNLGPMIVQEASEPPFLALPDLQGVAGDVPIGWRLAEPDSLAGTYWSMLGVAAGQPDWVDIQWAHLLTARTIEQASGLDLLAFAGGQHETSSAWVLFGRPDGDPDVASPNTMAVGLMPAVEIQDRLTASASNDSNAATRFGSLPLGIGWGWGTRERDGVTRLALDLVRSWPSGAPATLRLIYLDEGKDTFDLSYRTVDGQSARRTVAKTGAGQWTLAEFAMIAPDWEASDSADLIVDSNGDGDEVLHFVELRLGNSVAEAENQNPAAAGWRLSPGTGQPVDSGARVPAGPTPRAYPDSTSYTDMPTGLVWPLLGVPLLIWLLAVAAVGITLLAARLTRFDPP